MRLDRLTFELRITVIDIFPQEVHVQVVGLIN